MVYHDNGYRRNCKCLVGIFFLKNIGQIAELIARYAVPEPMRFPGLYAIGCTFFLFNIFLFIFNICIIVFRFSLYPWTFKSSFLHPTESLFVPAAAISFGTILLNITQYGVGTRTGDWLERTMIVLYWFYCALAVVLSSTIYLILWSTQTFTISQMTPIWIFPAYPLLIVGPHAGQLARKVPAREALQIIIGGYIVQGIGFMVSLMIYSAFLYRLMTHKLPKENVRPGMFVSVGPSGFTIAGLITMGQIIPDVVSPDFMGDGMGVFVGKVSMVMANWAGLWLWGYEYNRF
jgi:tellurite resistance protein TehA-like permease